MAANQPIKKIKSGDLVKVLSGNHKGKSGKVLRVDTKTQLIFVEGLGTVKRHIKPNQLNPRGGTKDVQIGFPISKVGLVVDEKSNKTSRVGFTTDKEGAKVRVARALKNKEIK